MSVGGHCAIFVAIIIIKVTNDLPGAQHISSRRKCQHKDNGGEFRVQIAAFLCKSIGVGWKLHKKKVVEAKSVSVIFL